MANQTIYPYGPGGQLPSTIGIVDDLVTGGSNQALSAQQGVVLKGLIDAAKIPLEYATVEEDGIFFVDNYLNIGAKIDTTGLSAFNLITMEDL